MVPPVENLPAGHLSHTRDDVEASPCPGLQTARRQGRAGRAFCHGISWTMLAGQSTNSRDGNDTGLRRTGRAAALARGKSPVQLVLRRAAFDEPAGHARQLAVPAWLLYSPCWHGSQTVLRPPADASPATHRLQLLAPGSKPHPALQSESARTHTAQCACRCAGSNSKRRQKAAAAFSINTSLERDKMELAHHCIASFLQRWSCLWGRPCTMPPLQRRCTCQRRSCCMCRLPPDSNAPAGRVCMWLYHRRQRLCRMRTRHI
jgi:hypothetical protein